MGIDVEIYIELKKEPSVTEYLEIQNKYNDVSIIDGEMVVEENICGFGEYISGTHKTSEFVASINISSCNRYYGVGCERGSFMCIYVTIKYLLKIFEKYSPTVFYGGDNFADIVSTNDDQKDLENLWEYFCKVGESPYRGTDYSKPKIEE